MQLVQEYTVEGWRQQVTVSHRGVICTGWGKVYESAHGEQAGFPGIQSLDEVLFSRNQRNVLFNLFTLSYSAMRDLSPYLTHHSPRERWAAVVPCLGITTEWSSPTLDSESQAGRLWVPLFFGMTWPGMEPTTLESSPKTLTDAHLKIWIILFWSRPYRTSPFRLGHSQSTYHPHLSLQSSSFVFLLWRKWARQVNQMTNN